MSISPAIIPADSRRIKISTLAMGVMVIFGLLTWSILVATPLLLFLYAVVDIVLVSCLLFRRAIKNEFAIFFIALSLLYSHSFMGEALVGLTDPESFTIAASLAARGLDLFADSSSLILASILFRNAILLGWRNRLHESLQVGGQLARVQWTDASLAVALSVGIIISAQVLPISILLLLSANLSIAAATMVCLVLARNFQFRLMPLIVIIVIAAGCFLMVSRSRLPIMVLSLSLFAVYFSRQHALRWKQLVMAVVMLLVFLSFGYFRQPADERGSRQGAGILSLEETGNLHLVGSHVIGLASRGELPSELSESVLSKVVRSIPGSGGEMLADRYIWAFFPAVAAGGGGFAYSAVAEWYVAGGAIGVVVAGLLLGFCIAELVARQSYGYSAIVTIVFFAQFLRQELAASLLTVITIVVGSIMLHALRRMLVAASTSRRYQSLSSGALN